MSLVGPLSGTVSRWAKPRSLSANQQPCPQAHLTWGRHGRTPAHGSSADVGSRTTPSRSPSRPGTSGARTNTLRPAPGEPTTGLRNTRQA